MGLPRAVLRVLVPLKCTCMPFLLHSFLNFSPVLGMYGTTMVALVFVVVCWVVVAGGVGGVGGLLVGMDELVLPLVEGPRRKLAVL